MRRHPHIWAGALCVPLMIVGCGSPPSSLENSSADATSEESDIATPPKEYYDSLLTDRMQAFDSGLLATDSPQVLWVNFDGATITRGYSRGMSFIPCKKTTTIPESGFDTADRTIILEKIAQYYSNAGVRIAITAERPRQGDYTTIHVGGRYRDLGCSRGSSVLGIAPLDSGNANPNDVGFAFVSSGFDLTMSAETIAHESGHSFGLNHTSNRKDIMYPSIVSTIEGFAIGAVRGQRQEQNGPLLLQKALGSGSATIDGSVVAPEGDVPPAPLPVINNTYNSLPNIPNRTSPVAGSPGVAVLASVMQILGQVSPGVMSAMGPVLPSMTGLPSGVTLQNPQGALSILNILQNVVAKQNGGQFQMAGLFNMSTAGSTPGRFGSLLNLIGLATGNPMSIVSTLMPMVIPMISRAAAPQQTSQTPVNVDVTQLMGMNDISDASELISLLPHYAQLIKANASGGEAQTMSDMVKIAISQRYVSINTP